MVSVVRPWSAAVVGPGAAVVGGVGCPVTLTMDPDLLRLILVAAVVRLFVIAAEPAVAAPWPRNSG